MQASIEVHTTNAQMSISNHIRRFRIHSVPPQMHIKTTMAKFKVNWDQVWAECGRKNNTHFMNDNRQKAYDKTLQAIKRMAQEGDMMMDTTNGVVIPLIAAENMRAALPEVNLTTMPKSMPDLTWEKGGVEITWERGSMEIVWDEEFEPDISFTRHNVEIKMRNFPVVKMREKGAHSGGKKVDKKV
ncbi:MAG: hypothetical protein IJR47_03740 [Clostridia bacterium]|nr:hypothetical protein [Clostridia bacterium]